MKIRIILLLIVGLLGGCTAHDRPTISLYLAVQRGDLDQVERHIYWGTDINQLDPDGNRALHVAASQGRQIIVKVLLKNGADIALEDQHGHTAIYYAVLTGRTQLTDLLIKNGARLDADKLLLAVAAANVSDRDVIRYLVGHGANLETTDSNGETPLLIAVRQGNHRLLRHLVDQGANVNVRAQNGQSAFQIAKSLELEDIALLLKRNGARED